MNIAPEKKYASKRHLSGFKAAAIVIFILFILYAATLLYPLVWGFLSALKEKTEYMTTNKAAFPKDWLFVNFIRAFKALNIEGSSMPVMLLNSLWYTVGGTAAAISVSTMVAYAVAKYNFPGRKLLYWIAIVTMMLPIVGALPSQFRMYSALKIINSPLMIITFASGFGFNFIVLHSFFKSLPFSYVEAGFIDGAGNFKCFVKLMLPQALPAVIALSVVSSIGFWNDYMGPLLFLENFPTLASGLYMFQIINTRDLDLPVLFAGLLISMIPVLVLFVIFQNKIMDISLAGGLKG